MEDNHRDERQTTRKRRHHLQVSAIVRVISAEFWLTKRKISFNLGTENYNFR